MNKLLLLCLLILLFLVPSLAVQAQEEEKSIVFDDIELENIHNAELLQKRRQFGNMSVEEIDGYIGDILRKIDFKNAVEEEQNRGFPSNVIQNLKIAWLGILFVAR